MVYSYVANNHLLLTCRTEEHFNNISCWRCGGVMATPVSHHHSVTRFIIVGIPAFVYIFHPRGGGGLGPSCYGFNYTRGYVHVYSWLCS